MPRHSNALTDRPANMLAYQDPLSADSLYGLSTNRDRLGLAPARYLEQGQKISQGTVKRKGYFGEIPTNDDSMMTEFSSAFEVGGKTVQYPLIVPTLTADELRSVRAKNITPEINKKAQQFALNRLSRGQDPFATTQELRYPQPQGLNPAPSTDRMQATPREGVSGFVSDVLDRTINMPSIPKTGIPGLDLFYANRKPLMKLMGVGDVQKTADRISYGEPLTSGAGGIGGTSRPLPETVGAALALQPFVKPASMATLQAAKLARQTALAGGRVVGGELAARMMSGQSTIPGLPTSVAPSPINFAAAPAARGELGVLDTSVEPEIEYLNKALLQALREKKAGLSQFASTTPREIQKQTKGGGYSVNLPSGQMPNDGLMMGRYANTDPRNMVIPAGQNLTQKDVLRFANMNRNALNDPQNYLGTWQDGPSGATYLDTSKRFDPSEIRQATKFGEKTGQLAGYDAGAGQTIPVGNWQQFINSPEFIGPSGRLAQMETVGRDYLSNFPTGNWWDIRGSNMENVYGKANLPQVAGFTASTAPVSAPRENIQTMSEYMRRHIKGEPILQPDWRVPAGMMTRTEGVQIGMEGSRANNLVRSGRGDYANLSGKKVGEEGRALMGDPNAVVLDRHQIRVSEDPSRGIYASGTADIITPEQYDALKNSIVIYTKNHSSKNANEASADIWTGIRETIKHKSDLFGTKFQGSAVTGDSKSYIDHFNDLIKDKAKHLGISIKEMEKKLNAGDANLMSILLATPVGLEAWNRFQEGQAKGD